jgi:hypothetical protein
VVVVELGAGMGELKNENLGLLSAGLGGSEPDVVLVVAVVALEGLKVKTGFVVPGAGLFVTWGPILAASDGTLVVDEGEAVG